MNTLRNHVLLFDEDCPLCQWYSNLFINSKMLDENGRESYIEAVEQKKYPINPVTAQNKIALVNTQTKEVFYGADSMVKILANNFNIIGILYKFPPINWFVKGLYSFVSFNRKIVIPTDCNKLSTCSPTRNIFWRSYFVVFCTLVISLLLSKFLNKNVLADAPLFLILVVSFVLQLILNFVVCKIFKEPNSYDYLGQVAFLNLLANFMLVALLITFKIVSIFQFTFHAQLALIALSAVFIYQVILHKNRVIKAGFNKNLIYTYPIIIAICIASILCLQIYLVSKLG